MYRLEDAQHLCDFLWDAHLKYDLVVGTVAQNSPLIRESLLEVLRDICAAGEVNVTGDTPDLAFTKLAAHMMKPFLSDSEILDRLESCQRRGHKAHQAGRSYKASCLLTDGSNYVDNTHHGIATLREKRQGLKIECARS